MKAFRLDIVPEQVARLADALRRLVGGAGPAHPGLVPGLDAGLEGTTAYLASEYVAAETLDVALRHLAPAPLDRALPILTQMADAIDAAWAAGVGHGALHPRDVFVAVDAHSVRLAGFGVLQAMESLGVKAPLRRPYTAPERVNGESWDLRADVYSLGAIAHELLTGRRPAGSGEQDGALTTGTSPEQRIQIRRVLSASLAEHPQHRFASARAFVDALVTVARGDTPVAIPVPEDIVADAPEADEARKDVPEVPPEAPPEVIAPLLVVAERAVVESEVVTPVIAPAPQVVVSDIRNPGPLGPGSRAETRFAGSPVHLPPPPYPALDVAPSSFPWAVLSAVAAAAIAVGIVIGYGFGRRAAVPVAPSAPAAVSSAQTDVPVASAQSDVAVSSESAAPESRPVVPPPDSPGGRAADVRPSGVTPRARVEAGRLLVRSIPSGALVTVDGRPYGQTPATVSNLALGRHILEVGRSGFVPQRQEVVLTSRVPSRTVSVRLRQGLPMEGK